MARKAADDGGSWLDDVIAEVVAASEHGHTSGCMISKAYAELDPETVAKLETLMAMPKERAKHSEIAKAMTKRGRKVSADGVSRHRRGQCACRPGP